MLKKRGNNAVDPEPCFCQRIKPTVREVGCQTEETFPNNNNVKNADAMSDLDSFVKNAFQDIQKLLVKPSHNNSSPGISDATDTSENNSSHKLNKATEETANRAINDENSSTPKLDKATIDSGNTGAIVKSPAPKLNESTESCVENQDEPEWSVGCKYKCNMCEIKFEKKRQFLSHLRHSHEGVSELEYEQIHGSPLILLEEHVCCLCSQLVIQDPLDLQKHFSTHNLSLVEYTGMYMTEDKKNVGLDELYEMSKEGPVLVDGEIKAEMIKVEIQFEDSFDDMVVSGSLLPDHSIFSSLQEDVKPEENNSDKVPWHSRCLYSCQLCPKQFFVQQYLKIHVENIHLIDFKTYQTDWKSAGFKINIHECELCGIGMTWAKKKIEVHMTKHHDLSLDQYFEEYKSDIDLPKMNVSDKSLLGLGQTTSGYDSSWANRCIFQCVLCENKTSFESRRKFATHVTSAHKVSLGDYSKQHGRTTQHIEKHMCQVPECNSVVLWDETAIYGHLAKFHDRMTLEQYDVQYMANYDENKSASNHNSSVNDSDSLQNVDKLLWANKCVFKCSICNDTFQSKGAFHKHIESVHNLNKVEYKNRHGKALIREEKHLCQIKDCKSVVLWHQTAIKDHLWKRHDNISLGEYKIAYMDNYEPGDTLKEPANISKHEIESLQKQEKDNNLWANQCIFKCVICSSERPFKLRYKFVRHVRTFHKVSPRDYALKYGRTMEHIEKHSCQVENCNAIVLWESKCMLAHIIKHKLTLDQYQQEYMENYKPADNVVKKNKSIGDSVAGGSGNNHSWANKCIFKCSLCGDTFKSKILFQKHVESIHNLNKMAYKNKYGKSIVHEEKHLCQIKDCKSVVLWHQTAIKDHLWKRHDNISLGEYQKAYMENYNPGDIIKEPIDISNGSNEEMKSSSWANKCIFKCVMCTSAGPFQLRYKLLRHIRSIHKLKPREYALRYGRTMEYVERHACQFENCTAIVLWEEKCLTAHISKHKLTLEQYRRAYMGNYKPAGNAAQKIKSLKNQVKGENSWANRCVFKCVLCTSAGPLKSRIKFVRHIKSAHKVSPGEYALKYGRTTDHVENHSCQIEDCNAIILWEERALLAHFLRHEISLEQYEKKYMANYKHIDKATKKMKLQQNQVKEENSWANRCIFKCVLCSSAGPLKSRWKFVQHIKSVHKANPGEYAQKYGRTTDHVEKHSCQVQDCNAIILWEERALVAHFLRHDLTLEQYEKTYMANYKHKATKKKKSLQNQANESNWANRCIFKCVLCSSAGPLKSRHKFVQHIKSAHKVSAGEYALEYGRTTDNVEKHMCQVQNCRAVVLWEEKALYMHIIKHELTLEQYEQTYMGNYTDFTSTSKSRSRSTESVSIEENNAWANRCIFKCSICDENNTFNSKRKFHKHIDSVHSLSIVDYKSMYGRAIVHQEKHICQVKECKSVTLWHEIAIKDHLWKFHNNISLAEYEKIYMKDYKDSGMLENKLKLSHNFVIEEISWANECKFTCKICKPNLSFKSRKKVESHVKVKHNLKLQQYEERHGPCMEFKRIHTCQICAGNMNWEKWKIYKHLYNSHEKMPLEEYYSNYIERFSDEDEDRINKTIFKCKACSKDDSFSTNMRSKMRTHILEIHNLNQNDYKYAHGSLYESEEPVIHACQVCDVELNWEGISLQTHIKIKHSMTVQNYIQEFMNQTDPKKKLQGNEIPSKPSSPDIDKEVAQWMAGSLYICHVCDITISGIDNLKNHLIHQHKIPFKSYIQKYKDFRVKPDRYHCCRVADCRKNIKWEKKPLMKHLKEDHDIGVHEYFYQYKPKMPKIPKGLIKSEIKSVAQKMAEV